MTVEEYESIVRCPRPGCPTPILRREPFFEMGVLCEVKRCLCGNVIYRPVTSHSPSLAEATAKPRRKPKKKATKKRQQPREKSEITMREARCALRMYETRDEGGARLTTIPRLARKYGLTERTMKRWMARARDAEQLDAG